METDDSIQKVCRQVIENYNPEKVILYQVKRSLDSVARSFKICVIIETNNRLDMEKHIYLDIDSDIPFDVMVYSPKEWDKLLSEKSSFACRIIKEGTYIHG